MVDKEYLFLLYVLRMSKSLDRLTLLSTFARIAERGSISAAARDLGLSQASASRQLADLETRLGADLVRRTTHTLALTEAGKDCLKDARNLLAGWDQFEEHHKEGVSRVEGKLKVVAPVALGQQRLAEAALAFQQRHPGVTLTWLLNDDKINFSEIGCDLWVKVGGPGNDSLIVKPLGTIERLIVAAPSLLKDVRVRHPQELESLPCAALAPFENDTIPLTDAAGHNVTIRPAAAITTNNVFSARLAAKKGVGFAVMPKWFVADDLKKGRLVDALPEWRAPSLSLNAAYLPSKWQPKRLRLLIDHMARAVTEINGII